jgi:ribosomal protein L32
MRMTHFWNNLHQIRSKQKKKKKTVGKQLNLKVFGSCTTKGHTQADKRMTVICVKY